MEGSQIFSVRGLNFSRSKISSHPYYSTVTEICVFGVRNWSVCSRTGILRLSVEYATRQVSCQSFTVKTTLLSWVTVLVSIGNTPFH